MKKFFLVPVLIALTVITGCGSRDDNKNAGHPVSLKAGHYYRVEWQMQKERSVRKTGIALVQDQHSSKEPIYVWFDKTYLPLPRCFTTTFKKDRTLGLVGIVSVACSEQG